MKRQPALAAALVLIAVGSGSLALDPAHAQSPGPSCTGKSHCVDVVVVNGEVQDVPNVRAEGTNHQIDWVIKTPGYSFPSPPKSDGIKWKAASSINDNGRMPKGEFPCNRKSAQVFHCNNANSTTGTGTRSYQYAITVVEDATGKEIVRDPWVINW
jgi:hypothetical protein